MPARPGGCADAPTARPFARAGSGLFTSIHIRCTLAGSFTVETGHGILLDLGGGRYAIGYAGDLITTSKVQTVKLQVYLLGNETAKPNATFSVKVNFA